MKISIDLLMFLALLLLMSYEMAVHLGIHWNMFIGMLQKRSGTWIGKKLWALRILAFAIVAYGMHAFAGRDITGKSVEDMVYEVQRKVILELADKESCVIIGRNADFILKDRDDVLNVLSMEICRKRYSASAGYIMSVTRKLQS